MRNLLTTFAGVLLALIAFFGIRYLVEQDRQERQKSEKADAEYRAMKYWENSERESLKTPNAELSPLRNGEDSLWPPVLENHYKWTWAKLRQACGKPVQGNVDLGELDYKDANGNLMRFLFAPDGVTVSYANPTNVTNPDLIGSINGISCLSEVK